MAKRKRLTPATALPDDLETKAMPRYPLGVHPPVASRPPIAQVAGDAASQAALEEVSAELNTARTQGRLVQALPLAAIKVDHLVRDRIILDPTEMETLTASLLARGQQTPIEVVDLGQGSFGLISGFRRLSALRALHADTGEDRFGTALALVKPIASAADSYVAMVEENEIRADLSFYERARLAAEAARMGIYPTGKKAVQALFAASPGPKRSKIAAFLVIHATLGDDLKFPAAIPEKVGLQLATLLDQDPGFQSKLCAALRKSPADTAAAERKTLDAAIRKATGKGRATKPTAPEVAPGITLDAGKGRITLSGRGVTADLQAALQQWLQDRT